MTVSHSLVYLCLYTRFDSLFMPTACWPLKACVYCSLKNVIWPISYFDFFLLSSIREEVKIVPSIGNNLKNAASCHIPHPRSGSKVKFPTPGEREAVKCPWYARGGMLRLQIDRCIKPWVPCERAAILPRINGTLVQSSSWEVSASLRKTSQDHHPRHRTWKPWTDSQINLRFVGPPTCLHLRWF